MNSETRMAAAIGNLYRSLDSGEDRQEALLGVRLALDCDRLAVVRLRSDGNVWTDTDPFCPEGNIEYASTYAEHDIRPTRVMAKGSGLYATGDLMTEEEIAACPVQQEFYRKYPECQQQLSAWRFGDNDLFATTAMRGPNRDDYSAEERRMLLTLSSHIQRVLSLDGLLADKTVTRDNVFAAFDCLSDPIVIFDVNGRVLHCNSEAEILVASSTSGLHMSNGMLSAQDPAASEALTHLLAATVRFMRGGTFDLPEPIALSRNPPQPPLLARALVSPADEGGRLIGVLRIVDPSKRRVPALALVQAASGLTPAEASLAIAIYRGLTIREYAEESGLAEGTVRTRTKQVCEKIGVRRQVELATWVAAIAAI